MYIILKHAYAHVVVVAMKSYYYYLLFVYLLCLQFSMTNAFSFPNLSLGLVKGRRNSKRGGWNGHLMTCEDDLENQ